MMAKNTSKSKEKSLPEKFKQFFGFKGSTPLNFDNLKIEPFHLTPHVLEDISLSNTVNNRLKAIKELYETVQTKPLEDHVIEILFYHTKDLVQPSICTETRHIVLQFYCFILQGQSEKMMIMRSVFFQFIKNHSIGEDVSFRLEMLKRLSGSGTTITYFEEEIGSFLLECLPDMLFAHKTTEFLDLLVNIIKYNAAFLDDDIIAGYMKYICSHCGSTRLEEDIMMCLKVMDAVLCYSHLPSSVLQIFVFALCLTVNVEKLANDSWKVMRNLLGTNIGHTSIFTLCLFLQDKKNIDQPGVMCGAVFFLSMSLWGSKRVPTLIHPPSAVLPSILMALKTNHHTVAFEVVSAVQRLVKKNDFTLETYTWEIILDIIEELLQYNELQKLGPPTSTLAISVHDFITATEEKISPYLKNRLYDIIENCSENRSVESVINLIKHRTQCIRPAKEDSLLHISNLLEKYFRNEIRPDVQLYVLETVVNIYMTKGYLQEDDAVAKVVLHELSHLENIQDISVRKAVVTFLLQIAENCMTELYFDFLNVIEKAMNRPFDILKNEEMTNVYDLEKVFSDVVEAVSGLINVFEMKLHMLPSSHCAKAYEILVQHMQSHYDLLTYYDDSIKVRKKILELFFKIRSNSRKQVGLIANGKVDCCVYVFCNTNEANKGILNTNLHPSLGSLPHMSFLTSSYISFEGMFQTLISCLKKEKDWTVLDFVLRKLPYLLQNKALILSGSFNINGLCITLSLLLSEASDYPETLLNAPPNITRTEFQSSVFPVIASLPAYHKEMGSFMHRVLVRCLQSGLVSRSAKVCIEGLTLCTLEMQDVMIKYLPAVLEKLAKISATVAVSISVLEFLSNLIRLPQLYVSFVEDQYRSIFAIALPYTNPFKFSQFTVALAHHVIAMWFLKCRIPFRKEFAKFITKSLQNNLKVPYKKNLSESNTEVEDTVKQQTEVKFSSDNIKSTIELHSDLFEIGLDFMAKYTFGMSSNVPKRSSVADFLLEKGQKNSWMIGHKIITITTSGCASKAFKYGLCERCYASCHEISGNMESGDSTLAASTIHDPFEKKDPLIRNAFPSGRRRHMSSFQHRNIPLSDELESNRHAKDDILIHKQTFNSKRLERRNTSYSPKDSCEYGLPVQETIEKNEMKDGNNQLCSCWCSGWAEIFIRRPTGNFSWMMKIQNKLFLPTCPLDLSLSAVSSLLLPVKLEISEKNTCDRISEKLEDSSEGNNNDFEANEEIDYSSVREATEAIKCPETSVPIRRANSSPDMSSDWANFENFKASQNSHIFISEEFKHDNALKETGVDFKAMGDNSSATILDPFASESCAKSILSSISAKRNPIGSDLKSEGDSNFAISAFRDRGHTISVMSSNRASVISSQYQEGKDMHRSGMNPSFVFLSLYHNNFFGPPEFRPIQLRCTEANTRALKVLDHIHPYDTHKIGVIYVGVGQVDNEVEILSNQFGSTRYMDFLRHLGNIVRLCDVDHEFTYVGGLDTKGSDGKFALVWHDDVMRVAFHVATLMPNKQSDPKKNNKKMHIGNDFVTIVYNESGEDYNIGTIKGHVTTACVIIQPEDYNNNVVKLKLKTKELLEIFAHCGSYIVSDKSLAIFVRQMALHANLASLILDRRQQSAHISNWLERLRTIKRLRKKIIEEQAQKEEDVQTSSKSNVFVDDFTDYV